MARTRTYPWEDWLSEKQMTFKYGIHFNCLQSSFQSSIYKAANALDMDVTVHLHGNGDVSIDVTNPPSRSQLLRLLQARRPLLT